MNNKSEISSLFIRSRFLFLVILAVCLMIADVRFKGLREFRSYIETALYPILFFINTPQLASSAVTTQFKSRAQLIEENERLSSENFMQRADLLRMTALEHENDAMRKLLNSPIRHSSKRIFAEIINIDSDPYLQRLVINRGSSDGVYIGMPVITDQGLVGQVIETNYAYSRILLIVDPNSAVPIVNERNEIRGIANGTGSPDELNISNVPRSADIQVGDLLVSSGLGGVYPSGYPVAVVTEVGYSDAQLFAGIKAKPLVFTDRIKYVLLFFYESNTPDNRMDLVKPKQPTADKYILRQKHIKGLIDSMTPKPNGEAEETQAEEPAAEQAEGEAVGEAEGEQAATGD